MNNNENINQIRDLLNLPPDRVQIEDSSVIAEIAFHFKECDQYGELEVVFTNGNVYFYLDVNVEVYKNFIHAKSKGVFLNQEVIPHFAFRRV
jgi:uncharacterized protein (UPF0276 family)